MGIKLDTYGEKTEHGWVNREGVIGPLKPGTGPRRDPLGDFPTGPEVGELLPNVNCLGVDEKPFDLHEHRAGSPAIFIFFRSAVW